MSSHFPRTPQAALNALRVAIDRECRVAEGQMPLYEVIDVLSAQLSELRMRDAGRRVQVTPAAQTARKSFLADLVRPHR